MINVTTSFIAFMKKTLRDRNLSPADNVICFLTNKDTKDVRINFLIIPLNSFESTEAECSLPFKNFALIKKGGCWMCSDNGAFFHLINSRITVNKENELQIISINTKSKNTIENNGRNSMGNFVKSFLLEHMKNEKLSRVELAINLKITNHKLNLFLKGNVSNLNLIDIVNITREFQGKNNIKKYFVLFEKFKK